MTDHLNPLARDFTFVVRGQTETDIVNGGFTIENEWNDHEPPSEHVQSTLRSWANFHGIDYLSLTASRNGKVAAVLVRNPRDLTLTRELLVLALRSSDDFGDPELSNGRHFRSVLLDWAEAKGVKL